MSNLRESLTIVPAPMDGAFLAEVLDELDQAQQVTCRDARQFVRYPYRSLKTVLFPADAGGKTAFIVATRNISCGGVCFLHRQMMHPGEKCSIAFPEPDNKYMVVPGQYVRARHIRGITHEIGIRFTRSISEENLLRILSQDNQPQPLML